MYDDTKINELKKKYADLQTKRRNLTGEIDQQIYEASAALRVEERKRDEWLRQQREAKKRKHVYMNIIFKWDNGIEFDTRKKYKLNEFKDFVFAYGLPTSFEVRG